MIDEPLLVDSGALIALFNSNDPYHTACASLVGQLPLGKTYTCWPVLTEAAYLLRHYQQQRTELLNAVVAEEFPLLPLHSNDVPGVQDVFAQYHDQDVDLADACLVRLANREGIEAVFTTDRRHFSVYRLDNGKHFRLLPEAG